MEAKDSAKIKNYLHSLITYQSNPMNPDFVIWLGRRMAYLGDYQSAIGIFHEGILKHPEDARFYRHRGHRYISTRQFDLAIKDLEQAAALIQDTEDTIEPDGIPNSLNTPVSSLHTNIYYHLGLAYYLKGDWTNALAHFDNCLQASQNDDMRVAAMHWLYMILRRMSLPDEASQLLDRVSPNMTIIENDGYHQLLLFYKGELSEDQLSGNGSLGSSEAVKYGIANWYYYNDNISEAKKRFQEIVDNGNWAAFGFIAAESEVSRMTN
ncbi:MAG: tetratricopeptide repeat protein [Saprospiraceae bacterium]|nr:tetratricopeptide repeat protein [Saprospiraceae bacterium]